MLKQITALTAAFETPALLCAGPRELQIAAQTDTVDVPLLSSSEWKSLSRLPDFSLSRLPITDTDIDSWMESAGFPKPEKPGFSAEPGEVAIVLKNNAGIIKGFLWLDLDFDWTRKARDTVPEQSCILRCIDLSVADVFRSETLYKVMLFYGIHQFLHRVVSPMLAEAEFPTEIQLDCVGESITPPVAEYGDMLIDRYLTEYSQRPGPHASFTFVPMADFLDGILAEMPMTTLSRLPRGQITAPTTQTRH